MPRANNKLLKTLILQLRDEHERNDIQLLNITFYLLKNKYACKSVKDLDLSDLMIVYDNLEINNEILTAENIDEYEYYIKKSPFSHKQLKEIRSGEKICLLNYYTIKGQLNYCKMMFKSDFNILD